MKMGGSKVANSGFTIVETLIVLAVTGTMLLMAATFVSGRQNKTQFQTAINSLQQQLQQIINQTSSGFYNNNADFSCIGTGTFVTLSNLTSKSQGSNEGCIFLGNALQFGTGAGDPAASQLAIIPIVGKQYSGLGTTQPVQDIATAKPRAVYPLGEGISTGAVSSDSMQGGLTVASSNPACTSGGMCYIKGALKTQTGAIVFLSGDSNGSLASVDATGQFKPGGQQFSLWGVHGSVPAQPTSNVAADIGNAAANPTNGLFPADSASICIASGTTTQSGRFTITSDLHVTMQIFGSLTCS